MLRGKGLRASKQISSIQMEAMERRQLMSTSVAVGSILYTVADVPNPDGNSTPSVVLYRSNLDGSNQQQLHSWYCNATGPANLFAYKDKLLFGASGDGVGYNQRELWASDGTVDGTTQISYYSGASHGIDPTDFRLINGNAVFISKEHQYEDFAKVWTTDGTTDGTHILIGPSTTSGDHYYYHSVANVIYGADYVQATDFTSSGRADTFVSDGSVAGTRLLGSSDTMLSPLSATVTNGLLQLNGTADADAFNIQSQGDDISVTLNGITQYFAGVTSIHVVAGAGIDSIYINDVSIPTTVTGGAGNDTIDAVGSDVTVDESDHTQNLTYIKNEGPQVRFAGSAEVDTITNSVQGFIGGSGDDHIYTNGTYFYVDGGAGNDTLTVFNQSGKAGKVLGGDGNDTIEVTGGSGIVNGGAGNNTIDAPSTYQLHGGNTITTGGTLHASFRDGVLRIYGSDAADDILLTADGAAAQLTVNGVSDTFAGVASTIIYGGAGNDRISNLLDIKAKIYGEAGNDTLGSSGGKDRIYGGDGNDWIDAGDNHDTVYGEAGDDSLFGGGGRDYLDGGAGANLLRGGDGIDRLIVTSTDNFHANVGDRIEREVLG